MIVRSPVRFRAPGHSSFVGRHEVDSGSIEMGIFLARTSTSPAAQPDDADDAGVAVDHDGGWHNENIRRQKREVGFPLPLRRVTDAFTRQRGSQRTVVVTSSRVNFFHLHKDEELWNSEDECTQPAG